MHVAVWYFSICLNFVFAALTVVLLVRIEYYHQGAIYNETMGSFEDGFGTDLALYKKQIKLQKTLFMNNISFNSAGAFYVSNPNQTRYVSGPESEVDQNWAELLKGQIIFLPTDEASGVVNWTHYDSNFSAWETGIAAYQQLDCINRIRRALNEKNWHEQDRRDMRKAFLDHCIDYLRQSIQCTADLTPVILYNETANIDGYMPWYEQNHTCRDWSAIHNFTQEKLKARPRPTRVPVNGWIPFELNTAFDDSVPEMILYYE